MVNLTSKSEASPINAIIGAGKVNLKAAPTGRFYILFIMGSWGSMTPSMNQAGVTDPGLPKDRVVGSMHKALEEMDVGFQPSLAG